MLKYYRFPSFRPNPASETKTAQECLTEILSKSDQCRRLSLGDMDAVPSSKGESADPKPRREEVKRESKGGGPGSWSAWKVSETVKRYEAKERDYEDTGENKNKPQRGVPENKSRGSNKKAR